MSISAETMDVVMRENERLKKELEEAKDLAFKRAEHQMKLAAERDEARAALQARLDEDEAARLDFAARHNGECSCRACTSYRAKAKAEAALAVAVADNAALLNTKCGMAPSLGTACPCCAVRLAGRPAFEHPGSALLNELESLRKTHDLQSVVIRANAERERALLAANKLALEALEKLNTLLACRGNDNGGADRGLDNHWCNACDEYVDRNGHIRREARAAIAALREVTK